MPEKYPNQNVIAETNRLGLPPARLPVQNPIYYGQCAEDYIALSILRSLAAVEGLNLSKERYLEIGANHPVATSATYLLHTGLGMTGVLVDANRHLIESLRRARPADTIIHTAVTANTSGKVDFFISDYSELSSLKKDFITDFPHVKAGVSEVSTIDSIGINDLIQQHFGSVSPLFMSIDVEGMDLELIEALDLSRHRPYLLQVEISKDWDAAGYQRIRSIIEHAGYAPVAQTDVNMLAVDSRRLQGTKVSDTAQDGATHSTLPVSDQSLLDVFQSVDIVSLDVFDTVLARKCAVPTDVFADMEIRHQWPGFQAIRTKAEAEARKKFRAGGTGETSLDEIYQCVGKHMPIPDDAPELELAAERRFLYAIPDALRLISLARQAGRRVIAITDMYLSSSQVNDLLQQCGVFVDRVYSSSDHRELGLGKYNGKIFQHVAQQESVAPERILHFGDNFQADFEQATAAGVNAISTPKVSEVLAANAPMLGELIAAAQHHGCGGIVGPMMSRLMQAPSSIASDAERFGYFYGGPLLAGFARFILAQAQRNKIAHLLLLARDGIIVQRTLDILRPANITWKTIPSSRRMTALPLFSELGSTAIRPLLGNAEKLSANDVLKLLSLDHLISNRPEHAQVQATDKSLELIHDLLLKQSTSERKALLDMLEPELADHELGRKAAWVDVGWALTSMAALNRLTQKSIAGFFVGSHGKAYDAKGLCGYLFELGEPFHVSNQIMDAVEVVELIFSDTSRSTAYLNHADGITTPRLIDKNSTERLRDVYIQDVQRGALAFIKDVSPFFDGLDQEALRTYNRQVISSLCSQPPIAVYNFLSKVPHDRHGGTAGWKSIGDYWKPMKVRQGYPTSSPGQDASFAFGKGAMRGNTKSNFRLLMEYRVLTLASQLSPVLTKRAAERFKRSALKRHPRYWR
jgi:predicted HAD superfamily hydrolase